MRPIERSEVPDEIRAELEEWKEELIGEGLTKDQVKYRYKKLKDYLSEDTHDKCMYCESKISHISYKRVEHIHPKSEYPEGALCWRNLGIACERCNTEKGDYSSVEDPLVNPYQDNPDAHFIFDSTQLFPRFDGGKGETTEQVLDLNAGSLVLKRKEKVEQVVRLVRASKEAESKALAEVILERAEGHGDPEEEYSRFCEAAFNRLMG